MPTTNANEPLHTCDHDPSQARAGTDVTADLAQTLIPDAPFAPETGTPSASADQVGDTLQPNRDVQTGDGSSIASSELPTTTIPGYEILGELGRGGMGVVYKARHLKSNRLVALKMVLSGTHAGRDELRRFQSEAEAVARLQHPHIVQVYDVGEHEGRPYFSLELCSGGSLEKKLSGTPLKAEEAAPLVEKLARAMQAAHSAHIIHRDLKPANVLLTVDGTPKITDFGLAKKLDEESGQTKSGAIMGTPSYMAPEQAEGKKTVGPLSDVYSLGAILYDCLTGRPPFRAPTVMDTLIQVIGEEPVTPRVLNARVPTDLETICLKCLVKEPDRRYASAEKLAEDLRRFQAGEPIEARPVGQLERGWRWCRRNAALASALGAVAVSLVVGAAVATAFAFQANANAATAQDNEKTANQEKAAAVDARNDLEKAHTELTRSQEALLKSNDRLTTSVARSLLRPLGSPVQPLPPLGDPEIESLWELASSKEDRLRLRFVEEALRNPVFTRQLKDRAAVALQAVVGLDGTRRTELEEMLGKHLQSKEMTPKQREDVAFALIHLGILDRPLAKKTAASLTEAMTRTTNVRGVGLMQGVSTTDALDLLTLSEGLSALAPRMEPKDAAQACRQATATLTEAMSKVRDTYSLQMLSQGLSALATRLEPKEAAAALTQAVSKPTAPSSLRILSESLSAMAARLGPKEAAQTAATLTLVMSKTTDSTGLQSLSESLSALAVRLMPAEAIQVCGQAAAMLTLAMSKTTSPTDLQDLSKGLSTVAARLEPKEATQVCGQAAAMLALAMSKTTDPGALQILSKGLTAVASRLEPKEAAQTAATLTATMTEMMNPGALLPLSASLSAVAARLEPKEAAQSAATLILAMTRTSNLSAVSPLSASLSPLAARLEPKEAAATLTHAMSKTTDPHALGSLSQGLAAVGLEPKEAAQVCGQAAATLTLAMSKTTDPGTLGALSQGLSAVAARLEPKEAAPIAASLTAAMTGTMNPGTFWYLSTSLAAVATRLEPKEGVATLTHAMSKATDPYLLQVLSQGLAEVATRLEPKEAIQVCGQAAALLTLAMSNSTNPFALRSLSSRLGEVATRLEPKEATRICGQAAALLTLAMSKTSDIVALHNLSEGLSALAARMEPKEAAQAAAALNKAMTRMRHPHYLRSLSCSLSTVAVRLEPKEAAQVCGHAAARLILAMSKTTDLPGLQVLSQGLSEVLARDPAARQRLLSVTATVAGLPVAGTPFVALACSQPALEPLPPPLPAQTLVELLKHPLCVGEPRRLVLDQLARHYHRPFADPWEFVEYAHNQMLGLDLTTPPQRPDLAATGHR